MPNGKDMIIDMEFEERLKNMDTVEKIDFIARRTKQCYEHMTILREVVEQNTKRSISNRIALIVAFAFLVGTGLIGWESIAQFFGM